MWIPRELDSTLKKAADSRPAVVLTGCRQAGKTSLLVKAFSDHGYVSLDVPIVAEEAEHSGGDFLKRHRPPVILDEIQYAPTLLRHVKADIDLHREETGRFLITGSQDFSLMEGVTESLAGRSSVLTLHSVSAREYEAWSGKTLDRVALPEWMLRGGYPEVHSRDLDAERFFSDYLATYLERDVRSILGVRSLRDFDRFMRLCAARTGQLVRHFANQGLRREIYFYRDHHGHEVDFLIPSAGRFALMECKWAESPGANQRGFSELETLVGHDRILSQTIITPDRGSRRASETVTIADSISLGFLSSR
jgi:predicted AAA+ superfamily ATPase